MKKRADGRYQKAVTLPNGKRKLFYGRTQAEVNRKILAYQYGAEQGPTFSTVAEQWQEWDESVHTWTTAHSHQAAQKRAVAYFDGERVKDITPIAANAFMRTVEARGLSKRTQQIHLSVLRSIFDFAITQGYITSNPAAAVRIEGRSSGGRRDLAPESDIKAIIAHHLDDRISLLPFFLMYSGLRLGEALALTDQDIDLKANTIKVSKKLVWRNNQPVIEPFTKSAAGIRIVPLLNVLKDALPVWTGYLFGRDGQMYTNKQFRLDWKKYAERTGVTCDRHTLRHEFATIMYDAGVDTKEAARITGHGEQVLLQTYQHIRESRQHAAADKLNAYLDGVVK